MINSLAELHEELARLDSWNNPCPSLEQLQTLLRSFLIAEKQAYQNASSPHFRYRVEGGEPQWKQIIQIAEIMATCLDDISATEIINLLELCLQNEVDAEIKNNFMPKNSSVFSNLPL